MYSSTLSLTSALDEVSGKRHVPVALPPGKIRYPLCRRLGGPQDRSGQAWKISLPPGFDPRTVQRVAIPTELSWPVHQLYNIIIICINNNNEIINNN